MNPFIIKLMLSIIVGGTYAVLMTWISERFGSKIGGLLIGLPSTSLIGYIFIALTQSSSVAVSGSVISPISIAAASLFLFSNIIKVPNNQTKAVRHNRKNKNLNLKLYFLKKINKPSAKTNKALKRGMIFTKLIPIYELYQKILNYALYN